MVRVEDLCYTCEHFDCADYCCNQGHYLLEGTYGPMCTIECEDYIELEEVK